MAKYIDIVWLSSAIHNFCKGSPITEDNIHHLISLAPTLEERKVGKWESDGHGHIVCTACNEVNVTIWKSKYCPCCGAEIRGSENE